MRGERDGSVWAMPSTPERSTRYPNVRWRGDSLYYAYRDEHGKRRRVKYHGSNPADAAQAQRLAQERAARVRAGLQTRAEADGETNARSPIVLLVSRYLDWLDAEPVSEGHRRDMRLRLEHFADSITVDAICDLTVDTITGYLRHHRWTATTQANARRKIVTFLGWCERHLHIRVPVTGRMIPIPKPKQADKRRSQTCRDMTADEFRQLLEGLSRGRGGKYRRAAYLLAALAGLRWAELYRVEWADLDLEVGVIEVRGKVRDEELPLVGPVCEAIDALPRSSSLVFPRKIQRRTWYADLVRAGICTLIDAEAGYDAANLSGYRDARGRVLGPYSLRKACATWLIEQGADVKTVMETMRHRDASTTLALYAGLRIERQRHELDVTAGTVLGPKRVRSCPPMSAYGRNAPNEGNAESGGKLGISAG